MRSILILLLLAGVAAALTAWFAVGRAQDERELESPQALAINAAAPDAKAGPQQLGRVSVEAVAGTQPKPAAAPTSIDDRELTPEAGADWAKLYEGWSTPRLDARLIELEAGFYADRERLCAARFAAGQYRVVSGLEMAGDDGSYDVLAAESEDGVIQSTRAVPLAALDPATENDEDDEARLEYQTVTLPQDVYADLYRLRSQVEWLRATLAARAPPVEDGH